MKLWLQVVSMQSVHCKAYSELSREQMKGRLILGTCYVPCCRNQEYIVQLSKICNMTLCLQLEGTSLWLTSIFTRRPLTC